MQLKEFNYQGKKFVYRKKGEGPLVVLLHGFGEDGTIWKNQFDLFPAHQLIVPDLPGSGESEMIDDMSMEGMADAIYNLISSHLARHREERTANKQHLAEQDAKDYANQSQNKAWNAGPSPVGESRIGALIGHSMGGYIALAFAEKYPDVLNAFGLFHSTAFADTEEKKLIRQKGIEFIKESGGYEFLKTAIPNLYSPENKQTKSHLIEEHIETVRNAKAEALVSYYRAMMQRPDRTNVLLNSNVSVLFVLGKYDTAVPLEDGLKQCHLPQLSYIHILEKSGHSGMVEEEKETNKILSQFVTTVENIAYT